MPAILTTIIMGLVNGQSAATVLGALSAGQWGTLIAGIGAELEPGLAKLFGMKTVSIGTLIESVVKAATDELTKKAMRDWLSANAEWAMKLQPGISAES